MNGRPLVELHFKRCRCQGSGFLHYPGGEVRECMARPAEVVVLSYRSWEELGRPRVADEVVREEVR